MYERKFSMYGKASPTSAMQVGMNHAGIPFHSMTMGLKGIVIM